MFPAERRPGIRCRRQQGLFFKLHANKECTSELGCEPFVRLLHGRPMLPVWSVSFSWPTLACWWPAGTVPWGQSQCNSEYQPSCHWRRHSPLWQCEWRERGRQVGPRSRVQLSFQSRESDHPFKGRTNKPMMLFFFSRRHRKLLNQTNKIN